MSVTSSCSWEAEPRIYIENCRNRDPAYKISTTAVLNSLPTWCRPSSVTCRYSDERDLEAFERADVLIAGRLNTDVIATHGSGLKLIQCTSAGVDRYHPFDWLSNGTTLSNASGVHAEKVGEFGLMATLMLHSRVPQIATNQRLKLWDRRLREPAEGCRVLVYGVGALGGAVAQRLQAAGFAVNGIRKSGLAHPAVNQMFAPEHFIEELKRTDILILACPLTPQTHKLVGPRELAVLPKGAGLLNISRAGVVDHLELTKSLENEHLSGAILDVFEEEPLPADDLLWDTKNLMVFPHVSADAPEGYIDRCLHILRQNLEHSAEGLPLLNTVDRIAGY